jgi:hypothetical protein
VRFKAWPAAVISSSGKPVCAKQNLSVPLSRGLIILCQLLQFVLCFVFLFTPRAANADTLDESARLLARKVWASIHGSSVKLEFRNLSSLRSTEFASVSAAFQEELQRRGVKILPADAAANIVVSVTQNPTEYIGVVQIQRKETIETVMDTIGLVKGPGAPEPAFSLMLHKELLFSQDSPILDFVLDKDSNHAHALGVQEISSYEWRGEKWMPEGVEHLPTHWPPERAARGAFSDVEVDSHVAYLPGELCRISRVDAKGWSCESSNDFITQKVASSAGMASQEMESWISAAQIETGGKAMSVVIGQDGLARLYEEGSVPVAAFSNWGSQIASVYSGCGSGWQLLVTGKGDWTTTDAIQAMDIKERRAQAISAPLEFPGPITVLRIPGPRTLENTVGNTTAIAVDRNLQTGRYEAYQLSISCSR